MKIVGWFSGEILFRFLVFVAAAPFLFLLGEC